MANKFMDAVKEFLPKFRKKTSNLSSVRSRMWIDSSQLTDDLYDELYNRNGVTHKVINKLVRDRFDKWFEVQTESEEFIEKVNFHSSDKRGSLRIRSRMKRARNLAMRHGYSIIFIGYKDQAKSIAEPVRNPQSIEYLRIIKKKHIKEIVLVTDSNSPFFGEVDHYVLRSDYFDIATGVETNLHSTRAILVQNEESEEVESRSLLKPCYNWINIFDNISWSVGQSFFRQAGGFPVLTINNWGSLEEDVKDDIAATWANVNSMSGWIAGEGDSIDFKGAEGRALKPAEYVDAGVRMLAMSFDVPMPIIEGVNAGAVTGSETNLKDYFSDIGGAQILQEQPIVENIFSRMQETNQLPTVDFEIEWLPQFEESPKEKAETNKFAAESLEIYERTGIITKEINEKIESGELIRIEKPEQIIPNPEQVPTNLEQPNNFDRTHNHIHTRKNDQESKFNQPKFIRLEDIYFRELDKIFKAMERSAILVTKGFFLDKKDIIKESQYKQLSNAIDGIFLTNSAQFNTVVNTNIANAVEQGIKSAEGELATVLPISAVLKNGKKAVISTEHLAVLNTVADDIKKNINVELGIAALNPSKTFRDIEALIKNTFSVQKGRIRMGVQNETNSALNQGNLLGYEKSEVVVGKRWISVIDGATTQTCLSLDGEVVAIGEPFSTGDFAPPSAVPPHPCRSSLQAVTALEASTLGLTNLSDSKQKIDLGVKKRRNDDEELNLMLKKREAEIQDDKQSLINKLRNKIDK